MEPTLLRILVSASPLFKVHYSRTMPFVQPCSSPSPAWIVDDFGGDFGVDFGVQFDFGASFGFGADFGEFDNLFDGSVSTVELDDVFCDEEDDVFGRKRGRRGRKRRR